MPNGKLILRDNDFAMAPGCGDRPLVSIGGCSQVEIVGKNVFTSGGAQPALELDPMDEHGLSNTANGPVHVDKTTALTGKVRIAGKFADDAALAALAPPLAKNP